TPTGYPRFRKKFRKGDRWLSLRPHRSHDETTDLLRICPACRGCRSPSLRRTRLPSLRCVDGDLEDVSRARTDPRGDGRGREWPDEEAAGKRQWRDHLDGRI